MDTHADQHPELIVESLRRKLEDYERRFRLLDGQMRVLEKERQKLSAVVNNTDAGFLVMGDSLDLKWANQVFASIFPSEHHPGALLGAACNRVLCGRESICEICPAAQALRSGAVAHHELRLEIEGQPRHIYATSIPIKSPDGVVEEVMVMLQNVSDLEVLRRSQEALKASEERFRSIFEKAATGMATVAADGSFLQVNAALSRFLGYSEEELLRLKIAHITYPEDLAETIRVLSDTLAHKKESLHVEKRYLRRDGTVVWGQTSATWLYDSRSEPLFAVALVQDITERKKAEEAVRREKARVQLLQEVAVAANEAFSVEAALQICLERVCDHMGWPVGHVYLAAGDGSGELTSTTLWHIEDPAHVEAFRRISEETRFPPGVGLPGRVLASGRAAWITDVTRDPNFPRWRQAAESGLKAGFGLPVMVGKEVAGVLEFFATEAIRPDERLLDVMAHIGTQLGRVIERHRAEEALRQSEEQLRHAQKMEAVGRLAGGVAHDFNNLLTVITGHSDMLLGKVEPGGPLTRGLEEIRKAAERAGALTRQLLAFSRKQVLQPRVMDLNIAVADMDKLIRRLIGEDVDLATSLKPGLGSVKADPGQVEQVIMNLVVNARDAMPEGGRITIETAEVDLGPMYDGQQTLIEPGRYVMLSVSDTGRGMDAGVRCRIFEPFFTTKEQGKGTGLGLSTVYGIVRQSGGYILVDSEPGKGSIFRIYLPRVEGAPSAVEAAPPAPASLAGSETILLVEDEAIVRELTHQILARNGYTVLAARDPADARLICERYEGRIHLMLTDVVMPMMSGIELADYLSPMRPDMKVLYMSGYTDENLVLDAGAETSTAFIHKPFTPDALAGKVRSLLDGLAAPASR